MPNSDERTDVLPHTAKTETLPTFGLAAVSTTITDTQRNGSIAAFAIMLGFSLSFTGTWSQGDEPWAYRGLLTLSVVVAGIIMQLRALLRILALPPLTCADHSRTAALFIKGVAIVLLGFAVHIAWDAAYDLGWL